MEAIHGKHDYKMIKYSWICVLLFTSHLLETTTAKTGNRSNANSKWHCGCYTNKNPNLYSNRVTVRCSIQWFMLPYLQTNPK